MFIFKTDIASEARRHHGDELPGVTLGKIDFGGISGETVSVTNEESSRILEKPVGIYTTLDVSSLSDPAQNTFSLCANAVAETVAKLLPPPGRNTPILAVGLGNRKITSDALGPDTAEGIIATRHLSKELSESFGKLTPVAVFAPGVLGTTGIESGEAVLALVNRLRPGVCVLIDALASSDHRGLCRSIQISNTGISPGSGVANHRFEISEKTLGIPCISVGVPTVVEAGTLVSSVARKHGLTEEEFNFDADADSLYLTPKDIDRLSPLCARAISFGLNLAFQPNLTPSDIEALLS